MAGSAAVAYRKDIETNGGAFGQHDSGWLHVAALLEQAAETEGEGQRAHFEQAAAVAAEVLGRERLVRIAEYEWGRSAASAAETVFLFVARIDEVRALRLAEAMASHALSLPFLSSVDRGRFLVLFARTARKLHQLDIARDRYRAALRVARADDSSELRARVALGMATLAQGWGNIPSQRRFNITALKNAIEAGMPYVEHEARYGLVQVAVKQGRLSDAITNAWAMLSCVGADETREAHDLATCAQLMVESGNALAARKLFVSALQRPINAGVALPALGGLAMAASRLGDFGAVDWALGQIEILRRTSASPYSVASALWDCARASAFMGRGVEADKYCGELQQLAERYALHEFAILAEAGTGVMSTAAGDERVKLSRRASTVIAHAEQMDEGRLPRRVMVAAAGSV